MLQRLRQPVADFVFYRTLKQYRSRLGYRAAPRYAAYLRRCRDKYVRPEVEPPAAVAAASAAFQRDGFASYSLPHNTTLAASILRKIKTRESAGEAIWSADRVYLGDPYIDFPELEEMLRTNVNHFLESLYESHVKIYYAKIYKSVHDESGPSGSQLWHSDSGPGTCTNLMIYLSEATKENGAMEVLPWELALELMRSERSSMRSLLSTRQQMLGRSLNRMEQRSLLSEWYRDRINSTYQRAVCQPTGDAGMVLAFRNNTLHKGGFPERGCERCVIVLHVYPADEPLPYEMYARHGMSKKGAYPEDPAF